MKESSQPIYSRFYVETAPGSQSKTPYMFKQDSLSRDCGRRSTPAKIGCRMLVSPDWSLL